VNDGYTAFQFLPGSAMSSIRTCIRLLPLLFAAAVLVACGNKGPLVKPTDVPKPTAPAPAAPAPTAPASH
jgi:predicted small lipoprotein YifL